ncbi:MAG: nucleoside-diphosphate kinase [Planctomycetes bacterium]|nr:nucleoside-diphosphate kinase [Planctomycetota bacterium]
MAAELAYVLITPYSLHKSRTGGIIGRLLSLTDLDLAGVHMYAPGDAWVERYLDILRKSDLGNPVREAFIQYVDEHLRRDNALGLSNRCMMLLFRGENALNHLLDDVVGHATPKVEGHTVRGTYGDFQHTPNGIIKYFEPAVICGPDPATVEEELRFFASTAATDGGVVEDAVRLPPDAKNVQTELVILKPENFEKRSRRPGNIIDVFSRTGFFIVGAKLLGMTPAQGEAFYRPLLDVFREKLQGNIEAVLRQKLKAAFDFDLPDEFFQAARRLLADRHARTEFAKIVRYMTGMDVRKLKDESERDRPGPVRCLALLYRGPDAIEKIRYWLGATNPEKAESGTVRSDFGRDLMRNAAHASDSPENAQRERKIIGMWQTDPEPEFKKTIEEFLAEQKK